MQRPTTALCRLLAIALTGALASSCSAPADVMAVQRPVLVEHPQPVASETGEVFPGSVRAREETDLAFRVPGKIMTRRVDAGATVSKGQVLAALDPHDADLNEQAARAALAAADADLALAGSDLRRYRQMLDKGFISQSAYDSHVNTLKLSQARRDQAQANLDVAANQARYTTLVAGRDGLITAVRAEAGQVVAAGQPVFGFAADSAREVVISVPEGRVDALRSAPRLAVSLWAHPAKLYQGQLRLINMQADPATRTHEARVTIVDADDAVRLGMSASVLMGERLDAALFSVPLSALAPRDGQPSVWVVADGRAHRVPVTVQNYVDGRAIVGGKLDPQMQMVSAGAQLLVEGQAVTPQERVNEAAAR